VARRSSQSQFQQTAVQRLTVPKSVRIYLSPFHSTPSPVSGRPCGSTYAPLNEAINRGIWPFDNGDDPSFFSCRHFGENLTWGVCRQNVRNAIEPGDVVVFFSFTKHGLRTEYKLCAIATVEEKVRQTDLWISPRLKRFRRYLNLLIRPKGTKWLHHEPGTHNREWHKDWVWRLADHRRLRKSAFTHIQESGQFGSTSHLLEQPLVVASNYVVFSKNPRLTHIAPNPHTLAASARPGRPEEWYSDPFSKAVKAQTIDIAVAHGQRASLRTTNLQRAHPHISWTMQKPDSDLWRRRLITLLKSS
jgi:hypothetical protein